MFKRIFVARFPNNGDADFSKSMQCAVGHSYQLVTISYYETGPCINGFPGRGFFMDYDGRKAFVTAAHVVHYDDYMDNDGLSEDEPSIGIIISYDDGKFHIRCPQNRSYFELFRLSGKTETVDFSCFWGGDYDDGLDDTIDFVSVDSIEVAVGDMCVAYGVIWRRRSSGIVFQEVRMEGVVKRIAYDFIYVSLKDVPNVIDGMSGSPVFSINGSLIGMLLRYSEVTRDATLLSKNAIKHYLGHETFQ